ncbi:MAG: tetratricopeptide repeat protein [Capsulimonas sp.]|uniref:tetratricopeptide repeat protein n=1 Tax=Capsulimonas sp. TaxID=2494211 RepID=UPI0032652F16
MNTKRFTFVSAVLAALALTGCSPDVQTNANINANLREARRQARIGKTDEARVWVDRAIKLDPTNRKTYIDGLQDQSPMGQVFGTAEPPLSILGIFDETGDDATLVAYMRDATNKFPDSIPAWTGLIQAEDRLGQTAQKVQDAKKMAAEIEKTLPKKIDGTILTALGQAYYDAGDEVNGEKNMRRAIATYPTNPEPQNALAYHYAVTNNKAHLSEALGLANQAIKLTKTQAEGVDQVIMDKVLAAPLDTLGWVQYRQGDYKNALANLMDAAAGMPDESEIRFHLGMVYLAMGDKFAARTELRHAILLHPDYVEAEEQANLLQNVPPPPPNPADSEE